MFNCSIDACPSQGQDVDILTGKKSHLYNLLQNDPKILYLQKFQSGDVQCLHEKKERNHGPIIH